MKTLRPGLALMEESILIGPGGYTMTRQKGVVLVRFAGNVGLRNAVKALLDKEPELVYEQVQDDVLGVARKDALPSAAELRQLGK